MSLRKLFTKIVLLSKKKSQNSVWISFFSSVCVMQWITTENSLTRHLVCNSRVALSMEVYGARHSGGLKAEMWIILLLFIIKLKLNLFNLYRTIKCYFDWSVMMIYADELLACSQHSPHVWIFLFVNAKNATLFYAVIMVY